MKTMRRLALAAVVCAGCAQVLGIDNTSAGSAAPTLKVERVSVGASVSSSPLDLSLLGPPVFLVDDATQPCGMRLAQGTQLAPDTWTPGDVSGSPSVVYTAPDLPNPFMHQVAFASRAQRAQFWAYEHPNPQPAPASMMALNVSLPTAYAATETFFVDAIGAWTRHQLSATELPMVGGMSIASTVAYASFAPSTPSAPARISAADVVLIERYSGATLTGVYQVPAFDQSDALDSITGAINPITADQSIAAAVDPAALATRYQALRPAVTGLGMSWAVYATAGYAVGTFPGVRLSSGPVAMTDTAISAMYPMPFSSLQWRPVMTFVTSESRTYMLGGVPATLTALAYEIADPTTATTLDLPAGMPLDVAITQNAATTHLTTDGTTVNLNLSTAAEVDLVTDRMANTYYTLEIDELDSNGTTVTRKPVVAIAGPSTHFELPPWFFASGKTYTINAGASVGGYPDAATGDLVTFSLPVSVSQADTAVFTVVGQ